MALAQYITAVSANMGGLAMGTVLGYSSPVAPLLVNATGNNLDISESQFSWFSSIMSVGALMGGFLGGYTMNVLGRRGTMIMLVIPYTIGWGMIAGAQNFAMLMVGRIITGICAGMCSVVIPTYNGEYPSPSRRGQLGSGFQLMVVIGILLAYAVGSAFDSFRYIAIVLAIIPFIFSGSMFFNKESPNFLLGKNREEDAVAALQHFRGKDFDINEEMNQLKQTMEENKNKKISISALRPSYVLKPLLIAMFLMIFQQISGINAVLFNLNTIFASSGSSMSDSLSSVLVSVMQVVATFASTQLIDRLGRKILLTISAMLMALSLVALGVFFYEKEQAANPQDIIDNLGWLPLTSLIVFIAAFSIGYGPIPWVMMGELFSSDVRELAASFATVTNWTMSFLVTLLFQPIQNGIHDYGAYWLFAGACVLNTIFCLTIVPETKGKSLDEITAMFGGPVSTSEKLAIALPEIIITTKDPSDLTESENRY